MVPRVYCGYAVSPNQGLREYYGNVYDGAEHIYKTGRGCWPLDVDPLWSYAKVAPLLTLLRPDPTVLLTDSPWWHSNSCSKEYCLEASWVPWELQPSINKPRLSLVPCKARTGEIKSYNTTSCVACRHSPVGIALLQVNKQVFDRILHPDRPFAFSPVCLSVEIPCNWIMATKSPWPGHLPYNGV